MTERTSLTYRDAGVDIDAGEELVNRIKPRVARTHRPEVLAGIGGFGAMIEIPEGRWRRPVLVAGHGRRRHQAPPRNRYRTATTASARISSRCARMTS